MGKKTIKEQKIVFRVVEKNGKRKVLMDFIPPILSKEEWEKRTLPEQGMQHTACLIADIVRRGMSEEMPGMSELTAEAREDHAG